MTSRPPEKKLSNIGRPTKNKDGTLQKPRTQRKGAFKKAKAPKPAGDEGKRGKGRPSILPQLSPELIASMITLLRDGNYLETAAAFVGVHKATLHAWLKQGAIDRSAGNFETPHADFHVSVEKALAEAEIRDNRVISTAATKNWTAAAWRLERRAPKRWGRRDSVDVGVGQSDTRKPMKQHFTLRIEDRTAARGPVDEGKK